MRLINFLPTALFLSVILAPVPAAAQEEVTLGIHKYRRQELSRGNYEEYEVKPRQSQPFIHGPGMREDGVLGLSPVASTVRNRTHLADAHMGLRFYEVRSCQSCHPVEAKNNLHVSRRGITCRQCHGKEPIPGTEHYFAPMNPIRRHAYVCSKCHEGAGASFATYVVHEPNPVMVTTMESFPGLFYLVWIMIGLAVVTFATFLPHTLLWGIRELIAAIRGQGGEAS